MHTAASQSQQRVVDASPLRHLLPIVGSQFGMLRACQVNQGELLHEDLQTHRQEHCVRA